MNELAAKAAEEATNTANGLLSKIFGPSAETMGMNMAQGFRLRAVQNQIRGLKKLAAICKKEGFCMKQVNIKAVFPYLEGIALEEEPVLEDMWANLMANYLDASKNLEQTVYPTILKQLSTGDVERIKVIYEKGFVVSVPQDQLTGLQQPVFANRDLCNIERLGIINEDIKAGFKRTNIANSILGKYDFKSYRITEFGKGFYEACQR